MNTGVEIDSFVKEMENMEKAENEEKEEEAHDTYQQIIQQAMDRASGLISLSQAEFIKIAIPIWLQYDDTKTGWLDDLDFHMVVQDTMTLLSQNICLSEA